MQRGASSGSSGDRPAPAPTLAGPRPPGGEHVLALNLGNTSLFAGLFAAGKLLQSWRAPVRAATTRAGFEREVVSRMRGTPTGTARVSVVALASVVPALTARVRAQAARAWPAARLVGLDGAAAQADGRLQIAYAEPVRLGADRVAAALGARALFPGKDVIVVDAGTATTVTVVTRTGGVAGGAIFPGPALWAQALAAGTAQLPPVRARGAMARAVGRSPEEAIEAGLVHGHAGAVRELVARARAETFPPGRSGKGSRSRVVVVATGGGAEALRAAGVVARVEPALVLHGLAAWARP